LQSAIIGYRNETQTELLLTGKSLQFFTNHCQSLGFIFWEEYA